MTPDNPRDAALTYAALFGWPVLATDPADKSPLLAHGVLDASTDPGVITGWFDRHPQANVGIATGTPGPMVLDVDHPELAPPAILALHAATEALTGRPTGDGRHLYFAGADQRTRSWAWGELRGTGSYVVAPPSLHASGRLYEWTLEPGALEPLPAAVLALVEQADREPFAPRVGVPHGERHAYLQRYAERLVAVDGYRDREAITAALEDEFRRACVPEPPPRPDEFTSLARWITGTDLMGRVRAVDAGAAHLGRVFERERAARGELPARADLEATVARYGGWGGRLELADVVRHGVRPSDALEMRFANGMEVYFPQQGNITMFGNWARTLIPATGGIAQPPAKVTQEQLQELYRALMLLSGPPLSTRTEADDLRDMLDEFLVLTEPVGGHHLDDAAARFDLVAAMRAREAWEPGNALSKGRPALVLMEDGRHLVRSGDLWTWFRHKGAQITSGMFMGRMTMIGLEQMVVDGREARLEPKVRRTTNRMIFYTLPTQKEDA